MRTLNGIGPGGSWYVVTNQEFPAAEATDDDAIVHLAVEVRPAHRRSRWAWHLVDGRDGSDFERGFDYDSPSDARRAGLDRLAELAGSLHGGAAPARHLASDPRSMPGVYLKTA